MNEPCGTCNQIHRPHDGQGRPCKGHVKKRNGAPCTSRAMVGLDVCGSHGGRARHAKAAGRRRDAEAKAVKLMVTLGEPIDDAQPAELLARRIGIRAGHVAWLLDRVRQLEPDALTWGLTKRKTAVNLDRPDDEQDVGHERRHFAGTDEGDTFEAKPHLWYALYEAQAAILEKLCLEAVRVGLDERRVQLAEREGAQWVRFIDGVLSDLGIDPTTPETATIVERRLAAVA